jgi:hypothetical protein
VAVARVRAFFFLFFFPFFLLRHKVVLPRPDGQGLFLPIYLRKRWP